MKQTSILEQEVKEILDSLKPNPDLMCLNHNRPNCPNQRCSGYSSAITCDGYINILHLREFERYKL